MDICDLNALKKDNKRKIFVYISSIVFLFFLVVSKR